MIVTSLVIIFAAAVSAAFLCQKKSMAKTFVLHDESVNSHGYWMMTAGCDISQFEKNPIMLWNHNNAWGDTREAKLPIGHWENIRMQGKRILADPVFDSDEFSQMIAQKVESNTLRMASVGAMAIEMSEDAKHIKPGQRYATVLKWKLKEASIVNIGANDNALVALYDDAGSLLNLSDENTSPLKPLNNKKIMNKEFIEVKQLLELSEDADEAQIALAVKKLIDDKAGLQDKLDQRDLADKESKKALFAVEVEKAIKDGRINAAGKDHLVKLYDSNPDDAEKFLQSIPARASVTEQINQASQATTTELADLTAKSWDELDKSGKLITLKDKYPDAYKDKYKEKFGVEPAQ